MNRSRIVTGLVIALVALQIEPGYVWSAVLTRDEINREVCVLFADDAIRLPDPHAASTLAQASVDGPLGDVLRRHGVERIAPTFSHFERRDTVYVNAYGITHRCADLSRCFRLRVAAKTARDALVEELRGRTDVVFVEPVSEETPAFAPNEPAFFRQWNMLNIGRYVGGTAGVVGADIDAISAWQLHQGSPGEPVGIIDYGVAPNFEFANRLYGNLGTSQHATMVAGIVAAEGNNGLGMAGVAWKCKIRSDISDGTPQGRAEAIVDAINTNLAIINNSANTDESSTAYKIAIAYAYNHDAVIVNSMPEDASQGDQYCAAFSYRGQSNGTVNVGATGRDDQIPAYVHSSPYATVAAPGGTETGYLEDRIWSTLTNDDFAFAYGTSMATPHVSALASMVRSYAREKFGYTLSNDEVKRILEKCAEDVGAFGFDNYTGYGRVNARRALELAGTPGAIRHASTTGGSAVVSSPELTTVLASTGQIVRATRYVVTSGVIELAGDPVVEWRGRGSASAGTDSSMSLLFDMGFCELVSGG